MGNYKYKSIDPEDFSVLPICILKTSYKDKIGMPEVAVNNIVRSRKKHMLNSMSRCLEGVHTLSPYHFHEGIEILQINCGSAYVIVNDTRYYAEKDDILIVNPFENHGIYLTDPKGDFSRTCLIFEPTDLFPAGKGSRKLFFDQLRDLRFVNFISHKAPLSKDLCQCVEEIVRLSGQHTADWPIAVFSNLVKFYSVIVRGSFYREETSSSPYQYEFAMKMSAYVDEHIAKDLTTEEVAAYCGYSVGHFCRLFKMCFNRPFKEYLNICRVEKAKELIENYQGTAGVYREVGFSSVSHFSNIFKKHEGISPTEYFKHIKKGK
ncbi:MAG: helix-turn-helix transcriptional regulator [Clostridia bacterium]|nr:helix-turn-helix transcriptional regulator [Clostridia bacterium]